MRRRYQRVRRLSKKNQLFAQLRGIGPSRIAVNRFLDARIAAPRARSVGSPRWSGHDDWILLDAGLYGAASKRQPSRGGIGAIIRPRIEGNRRAWGSIANRVDDHFE